MPSLTRSLIVMLVVAWSSTAGGTATIVGVGDLPGGAYESLVNGVSDDGGVVFGNSNVAAPKSQAFQWTEEFGIEGLGVDPEGTSAVAASSYGHYVAVTSLTPLWEWFIYTAPLGLERIADGDVVGISADASVTASNDTRGALRWTAATGAVLLDVYGSDSGTRALGISADGEFIVGSSYDALGGTIGHAVRWNAAGVPEDLGDLPGGTVNATAIAASADGSAVTGTSSSASGVEAFRWTAATGMQGLGMLPGGEDYGSRPTAISSDGIVVLGQCKSPVDGILPCVWDTRHGMRELAEALESDHGLDLTGTGWWLWNVTGISADRRTVVGTGLHYDPAPGVDVAYEGYVVRLSTPLPEPRAASLGGVSVLVLGAMRRRSRRAALAAAVLAAILAAGAASAQVAGTDCDCTQTGAYVSPDAGVRPNASAVSPGGAFRVDGGALPGPITIKPTGSNDPLLQVQASDWGWSPDGDRIVILTNTGSAESPVYQYFLYDLSGGPTTTWIWDSPANALQHSVRLRFSEDGSVLLFASLTPIDNERVDLQAVEVATGATFTDTFAFFNPPANFDDDSDPEVAGWGFGPDPTRIAYGYTTGQGNYTRVLANVQTGVQRGRQYTAYEEIPFFSPCGDVFAERVQQLAGSGEVTVTLYPTADPQAAQIGNEGFPNGLAVEVRANADDHVGLLGGTEYPIANNAADDSCTPANDSPAASFAPPTSPVAGQPAAFTDASTDADGTIVAWRWDFGDGATSSARNPSHTYDEPGAYTVRLTVTDDDGATDVVELEVHVCGDFANAAGRILFSTDAGVQGDGVNRDLFEFDAATRATAQITDSDWCRTSGTCFAQFGGSGTASGARFSPDGSQIAFVPGAYGENGVWVMDADGSNRRRLTDGSGSSGDFAFHLEPVWSPDGAWIAFVNRDVTIPADQTGLYMVRADGSGLVHVPGTFFRNPPFADKAPDFFPEIQSSCAGVPVEQRGPGCYRIAYIRDSYTLGAGATIRTVRGDGSEPSLLVPREDFYTQVRVSPDGSRLALQRDRRIGVVYEEILVVDLANLGMPPTQVTFSDQWADSPVWSPDGALLAYRGLAVGTTEYDLYVTDTVGCTASALRAVPGVAELPHDWKPGVVSQHPVSVAGYVTGGLWTTRYGGIEIALSGDATATAISAPDGSFRFDGLPAGGSFFLTIVSAPGFVFDPTPIPIELGGNVVNVSLGIYPDEAILSGFVRFEGAGIEGMVIRAEGPGGPFEATTDTDGRYSLTTRRDQTYTISGSKPGYRLDPATRSVWVSTQLSLDLTAIAVAELPPGRLAFTRSSGGDDEIYALDLSTLTPTNLTNDPASDRDPAWSPDGTRIAFTSTRNGLVEIFLMDADGANPSGLGLYGFEPAWSPDGAWLAYATGSGLGLYDLTTGASWSATFDPGDHSPRWLLDGSRRIAFERSVERQDGEYDVDLFTVDVSDLLNPSESVLVERPGDDLDPAFGDSLTGARFAYATADGDPANEIGISAEFDGSTDRTIPGRNPTWSPDGRFVAYDDDAGSLWLFEPGSGNPPIALTDGGTTGFGDADPDWRPSASDACTNGLDDDGDGYVDAEDPGCLGTSDPDETRADVACDNGVDDDGDGLADATDPGCPMPLASPEDPLCDNGLDDDGDGLTDFDDPMCEAGWPYWETAPACGLGGELVLLYAALVRICRRRVGKGMP
jgi:Tol biopolymer transport system component/uncharacterized membrane protein